MLMLRLTFHFSAVGSTEIVHSIRSATTVNNLPPIFLSLYLFPFVLLPSAFPSPAYFLREGGCVSMTCWRLCCGDRRCLGVAALILLASVRCSDQREPRTATTSTTVSTGIIISCGSWQSVSGALLERAVAPLSRSPHQRPSPARAGRTRLGGHVVSRQATWHSSHLPVRVIGTYWTRLTCRRCVGRQTNVSRWRLAAQR